MRIVTARAIAGCVTIAGVIGFVGLFVASHYAPDAATYLRVLGLIWFFVFGAIRITLPDLDGRDVQGPGRQ
jgi:ABC-type Fe3+-siderophore transport system permease subunit